jgi:uncharacterized protein (TIGR00297 family)
MRLSLWIGGILAGVVAGAAYRLKFLNASGAAATFLMGAVIFGVGQLQWSVPMLTFFVLSSLLSKLGKGRKAKLAGIFAKSDARDAGQVLSNGGIPAGLLLLDFFFPHPAWFHLYLSALAAVTADTWGTEIGTLFNNQPRSIVTMKKTAVGASGGVTLHGTLGALAGAWTVAASGQPWLDNRELLFLVALAGFLGGLVDSLLGATVQAQYRRPVCARTTESHRRCCDNVPTMHISGLRWVNNDVVNLCCSISGAAIFYLLR